MKNKKLWTIGTMVVFMICLVVIGCKKGDSADGFYLSATKTSEGVALSWAGLSDEYTYLIYRSASEQGDFSDIYTVYDGSSYLDENPLNGDNYYYVLAIHYFGEDTKQSNVAYCYFDNGGSNPDPDPDPDPDPSNPTISAPTGLNAVKGATSISVSWNSVSNAYQYSVYRASSASGSYSLQTTTSNTSYTDNSPLNGMNYYKVKAKDSNGNTSEFSDYCSCSFSSTSSETLSAPTNVSATNNGSTMVPNIYISWTAVSGASKYNIYRASSASGSYSKIGTSNYNSYNDSNPLNGTNYYKVTAVNASGKESDKSSYATASYDKDAISPCPPSITSNTANASTNKIIIKWSYSTSSGCGKPTKVTAKIYEPTVKKWMEDATYSASTTTHTFYYGMYQDSDGWVKMGILVENDYGTAQKLIIYNTKTKQWLLQ